MGVFELAYSPVLQGDQIYRVTSFGKTTRIKPTNTRTKESLIKYGKRISVTPV